MSHLGLAIPNVMIRTMDKDYDGLVERIGFLCFWKLQSELTRGFFQLLQQITQGVVSTPVKSGELTNAHINVKQSTDSWDLSLMLTTVKSSYKWYRSFKYKMINLVMVFLHIVHIITFSIKMRQIRMRKYAWTLRYTTYW